MRKGEHETASSPTLWAKRTLVGSPACSPHMLRCSAGRVARPRSAAMRTSSPTPDRSRMEKGFARSTWASR